MPPGLRRSGVSVADPLPGQDRPPPNAIALNSIQFNIARVIGPLLAGVALHRFGMVSCFTLNGISFLVVMASLLSLHVKHTPTGAGGRRMFDELKAACRSCGTRPACWRSWCWPSG